VEYDTTSHDLFDCPSCIGRTTGKCDSSSIIDVNFKLTEVLAFERLGYFGGEVISPNRIRTRTLVQNFPQISEALTVTRIGVWRAAPLAGASLITLAALSAPAAAGPCSAANQMISMAVPGPIFSTGGSITINNGGAIIGNSAG
jgi:hypothetical protein